MATSITFYLSALIDAAIVSRYGGSRATAFGVHGLTAAVMLIISGLLLFH